MGWRYECHSCGGSDVDYTFNMETAQDEWYCKTCRKNVRVREIYIPHPAERARAAVYATGNRWAIENWNATHN